MKICFWNPLHLAFDPQTPFQRALAGAESALCYVLLALQAQGHTLTLLHQTQQRHESGGITCLPLHHLQSPDFWATEKFDWLIGLHDPQPLARVRDILPRHTKLAFWAHHNVYDDRLPYFLEPKNSAVFDRIICVSLWQRQTYLGHFPFLPSDLAVLPNAMAPAFENLFPNFAALQQAKQGPLTLVYTATPDRGLMILLLVFPALKALFPLLRLQIYCQPEVALALPPLEPLILESLKDPQIVYIPPLAQPRLAESLRSAHILAYPATCSETFGINLLEALAAGCRVVSTEIGALAETSGGQARLLAPEPLEIYSRRYFDALRQELELWYHFPQIQLKQVWHTLQTYIPEQTWKNRALQWEVFFQ